MVCEARANRPQHLEVVLAVEVRVDPALEAHLGRPERFGLDDAPCDLFEVQKVRAPRRLSDRGPLEKAQNRHLKVQTLV